jgi:hypothetical protein
MGIQAVRAATSTPDWWARAHPALAAEEAALARQGAVVADWRKHEAHGTAETLLKARHVQQGAMARLFMNGHLSIDQLAWSAEIRTVAERIGRDVAIGSISFETRVDNGFSGHRLAEESLGRVRAEMAYSKWRGRLKRPAPVLAMIVEDLALRSVARAFRMRDVGARMLLIDALDDWPDCWGWARDRVDEDDLVAMQRRLA